MQRPELGEQVLDQFFHEVEDIAMYAKPRQQNGRFLDMFLQQDKKKVIQYEKQLKNSQEQKQEGVENAENENKKSADQEN